MQETDDGTEVRMKMRYGMPIYAQVGDPVESAQFIDVSVDEGGRSAALEILNDGNKHARLGGNFGVWPSDEFPGRDEALKQLRALNPESAEQTDFLAVNLPGSVILPGDQRALPVNFGELEDGEYTVQFNATFAQLEITDTVNFTRRDVDDPETYRVAALSEDIRLISATD